MLYSRTLLFIHSKCTSLHLPTPNSQSISLPAPLATTSRLFMSVSLKTRILMVSDTPHPRAALCLLNHNQLQFAHVVVRWRRVSLRCPWSGGGGLLRVCQLSCLMPWGQWAGATSVTHVSVLVPAALSLHAHARWARQWLSLSNASCMALSHDSLLSGTPVYVGRRHKDGSALVEDIPPT